MRVRRFSLVRLRDEERGAVLAIVGISLVVLLGMLVLTFDLGRGVAIKRNMVNAADAGALAAARECGLARGETEAMKAATQLVVDNNDAATVTGFQIDPGPAQCAGAPNPDPDGKNTVTVTVSLPQEYFFAQIFGFNGGTVRASATAEWTPGVANPVPLKLDAVNVEDCKTENAGQHCFFAFDNSAGSTGAQRGILDFPEGWPSPGEPNPDPSGCTSQAGGANDLVDYINQMGQLGSSAFVPVLWAPAVWVCAQGGESAVVVKAIEEWLFATKDLTPKPVVYFPEVACDGPTAPCYPWQTIPGHEAYPVTGFVGMTVEDAWKGQEAKQHCTFEPDNGNGNGGGSGNVSSDVFCVELSVAEPGQPGLQNAVTVRLVR